MTSTLHFYKMLQNQMKRQLSTMNHLQCDRFAIWN